MYAVPVVAIELDKPRVLRFDMNTVGALRKRFGPTVFADWKAMKADNAADPEMLVTLLWACLRTDDPAMTPEQAGGLLYPGNVAYAMAKVQEIMKLSMSEADGGTPDPT